MFLLGLEAPASIGIIGVIKTIPLDYFGFFKFVEIHSLSS
jgi:hypothetical protein